MCNILVSTGLNTGGAEKMLLKLLTEMTPEKRKSYLIISMIDLGTIGPKILELNVPVITLHLNSIMGVLLFFINIIKTIIKYKPTALIGWMYHGNLITFLMWIFCFGRPRLVWNIRHSIYDLNHEKKMTQFLIKFGGFLSGFVDVVILNSQQSLQQHLSLGYRKEKCIYIPNGFDTKRFCYNQELRDQRRYSLGVAKDQILIGMIARNHPIKDYSTFIDAMSLVYQKNMNIKFIAVGRNVDTDKILLSKIRLLGLQDNFILLPEDNDTPSLFNALDVFCLTSLSEGFPNVVGEAMACGLFVVATDVGQTRDIISEFGAIVPVKSPDLIAQSIIEYLQKSEIKKNILRTNSVASIVNRYEITHITQQYSRFFDSDSV